MKNGERGFVVIYGLVILLLASVGGTALLYVARKNRSGATDYCKTRTSTLAAMAALKACEGQFLNDPVNALAILKKARDLDPGESLWLLGSAANSGTEQRKKFWQGGEIGERSPEFSARLIGFDEINCLAVIEGRGYSAEGGRKKALASYHLGGLGINDLPIGTGYGLYLGGRLQNCNARISIKGDVYLSMVGGSPQHFNQGGMIYGNLKTLSSSNKMDLTGSGSLTVTGNAFMQCQMEPQALFFIKGDGGFTNTFSNFTSAIRINGNAYFIQNANFGFTNCIDGDEGGGKTAYKTNAISADRFKDFASVTAIPTATAAYVATRLGMTTGGESPFGLNLPTWGTGVVQSVSSGSITGENVESWWISHQSSGTLFKDEWLVIQLNGDIAMNGGTFTRKAIWITGNRTISVNQKWYNCTSASNTLIIVNGTGCLQNMGVASNQVFRGLIYVTSTSSNMSYQFGNQTTLYGMIQHAGSASFNLNSGSPSTDSLRIWFTEPLGMSAIQEIVNTGIILAPGLTVAPERSLSLMDAKIRPKQLNLQL